MAHNRLFSMWATGNMEMTEMWETVVFEYWYKNSGLHVCHASFGFIGLFDSIVYHSMPVWAQSLYIVRIWYPQQIAYLSMQPR